MTELDIERNPEMELWDIYNIDREKTGRTVLRGEKMKDGEYHISVHIVLKNPSGEILIQQRAVNKENWPGKWDIAAAAGNVLTGESARHAAQRELMEETGISCPINTPARMTVSIEHCFGDWYVLECDKKISELKLQSDEVEDAKWAGEKELARMLESGELIDYFPGFIEMLLKGDAAHGAMRSWRGRWQ